MPISYQIDEKRGVVLTRASGVLTDDEVKEHKRRLAADSRLKPGMVELSDVRSIERLDITSAGIRHFVAQDETDRERLSDYKLAIVASQDLVFGMARMYEMLTDKNLPNVEVFRTMDEAKAWLGRWAGESERE